MISKSKELIVDKNKFLSLKGFKNIISENTYLNKVRSEAKEYYNNLNFPSIFDERWKYTSLKDLLSYNFNILPQNNAINEEFFNIIDTGADNFLFLDGWLVSNKNIDNENITICSLNKKLKLPDKMLSEFYGKLDKRNKNIFCAMNTGYNQDGIFINVNNNYEHNKPIHIYISSESPMSASIIRNFFIIGENASVKVTFFFINQTPSKVFINNLNEIFLKKNSRLKLNFVENCSSNTYLFNTTYIEQFEKSNLNINTYNINGALVRNEIFNNNNGEYTNCQLNGLYFPNGEQHFANYSTIEHLKPHCESNQLYKGVIDDSGSSIFNGKLLIHPIAQKTNAFQQNNNLLLSDNAVSNSKPELEIYADDVKCSHGSTTGQLNDNELFYLRSRGIKLETARKILLKGFLGEIIQSIGEQKVEDFIDTSLQTKFIK